MEIKKIGMLSVIERLPKSMYKCICDCGNERLVKVGHFNTGAVKSCGCHWKTGMTNTREAWSYANMMARCHNPKNKRYKDYGAKGIVVCEEWRNSRKKFYEDMGPCPDGFQIDRIDNTKGYFKENCRWVDPKQNMINRSISLFWIVDGAKYSCLREASFGTGKSQATIRAWCQGRFAEGRYYPPKSNCSVEYVYPKELS